MNKSTKVMEDHATNISGETTIVSEYSNPVPDKAIDTYAATIVFHPTISYVGATKPLIGNSTTTDISRNCSRFINDQHLNGVTIDDPYISRKPLSLCLQDNILDIYLQPGSTPVAINNNIIEAGQHYPFDLHEQELLIEFNKRVFIYIHKKNSIGNTENQLNMLGISDEMQEVRDSILRVADTDIPVLIRGESGIGKELVASALHQYSKRANHHFLPINVGAIAESLIIAELFGVSKGSFTGATANKSGFFQQANNGTLFLDEIGDARDDLQLALLRALETGEIWPVGSAKSIQVNTRLVTATDACLESKLENKAFRNPLLQRLSGYEIWIAPLRSRKVDIGILIAHFLQEYSKKLACDTLLNTDNNTITAFLSHFYSLAINFSWPGNIRQLRNVVQQVIIHNKDTNTPTLPKHLITLLYPSTINHSSTTKNTSPTETTTKHTSIEENIRCQNISSSTSSISSPPIQVKRKPRNISQDELEKALEKNRYELKNTAEMLGISRAAVYKLIESNPLFRKAGDVSIDEIKLSFSKHSGNFDYMVDQLKVSKSALKRRLKEIGLI